MKEMYFIKILYYSFTTKRMHMRMETRWNIWISHLGWLAAECDSTTERVDEKVEQKN